MAHEDRPASGQIGGPRMNRFFGLKFISVVVLALVFVVFAAVAVWQKGCGARGGMGPTNPKIRALYFSALGMATNPCVFPELSV